MSVSSEPTDYDSHDDDTDTENQHLLSSNTVVHSDNQNGISWYFAVFLIVNAALGAGLLNFPKSFDNAGGILVSTIFHLVSEFCFFLFNLFGFRDILLNLFFITYNKRY
jgi:hypothetical protein